MSRQTGRKDLDEKQKKSLVNTRLLKSRETHDTTTTIQYAPSDKILIQGFSSLKRTSLQIKFITGLSLMHLDTYFVITGLLKLAD